MAADTPIARHAGRRAAAGRAAPALAASAILASSSILALGCELTEVTVFEPEDVIIAESQVVLTLAPDYAADISMTALALLHRTNERDGSRRVMGATVRVSGESGATVQFVEQDSAAVCLVPREEVRTTVFGNDSTVVIRTVVPFNEASCYRAELSPSPFAPGERLSLEITAPDGRVITGASRTPGAFSFMGLAQEGGSCRLDPTRTTASTGRPPRTHGPTSPTPESKDSARRSPRKTSRRPIRCTSWASRSAGKTRKSCSRATSASSTSSTATTMTATSSVP